MNIFVLDPDPKIAASMHCDQHLHKMILESAQMLSTLTANKMPVWYISGNYYKTTHPKHPCNLWLQRSFAHAKWLVTLCQDLDDIRMSLGADSHASMAVVNQFAEDFGSNLTGSPLPEPESFIFCGPALVQYNRAFTVPEKYQQFYRIKKSIWESEGRKMTWNGRAVPEFMNGEI